MTPTWIKLEPPPAMPAPYDGEWYWFTLPDFTVCKGRVRAEKTILENVSGMKIDPIAWQPYIEPQPYVESE
jgi:hypothetical protein